jgi:Rrf2 family nitric oxide-sensitive transcriptional repressor
MRLTTFSDYTIRTLVYLGLKHGQLATISEIAEAYEISGNHLMKVVHQLGQQGYVETVRGKGGGLRLVRDPASINIGQLVRMTEGSASLLDCLDGPSSCNIQPACQLIAILREAQDAMFKVLDSYTLADILQPEAPLAKILIQPRAAA